MNFTDALDHCDLPGLIARHCGADALRGLKATGGTIRDPRPGCADANASFSLWKNSRGVWLWKKRGRNAGAGNAFAFLLSLGLTGSDARAAVLAFTGDQVEFDDAVRPARQPVDLLTKAKEKLAELFAPTHREVDILMRRSTPITVGSPAMADLQRRGLWPAGDLDVAQLGQDLLLVLRHPVTRRVMNVKRRRFQGQPKYELCFASKGTPPWVNPGYGQATRVMIVEGELNAAAAWRVVTAMGLDFDVMGLPGTDTWPYLEGLNREVWIYADADESGEGMRARLQDLARECGAPRTRQIPALPAGQDFCDVLGSSGLEVLALVIHSSGPEQVAAEPVPTEAARPAARQGALLGEINLDACWPMRRS